MNTHMQISNLRYSECQIFNGDHYVVQDVPKF